MFTQADTRQNLPELPVKKKLLASKTRKCTTSEEKQRFEDMTADSYTSVTQNHGRLAYVSQEATWAVNSKCLYDKKQ